MSISRFSSCAVIAADFGFALTAVAQAASFTVERVTFKSGGETLVGQPRAMENPKAKTQV